MQKLTPLLFWLVASTFMLNAADDYQLGPDSMVKPGVPQGKVQSFVFTESAVFPAACG